MPSPLDNPFSTPPKTPRSPDDAALAGAILGPEAEAAVRRALGDTPVPHRIPEPTDIISEDELREAQERESRENPAITADVRDDVESFESGRTITLDLREVLSSSLSFLSEKAPPSWVDSLRSSFPDRISLSPEQRRTIETAIAHGFTRAILLPGADTQGITTIEREREAPDPEDPETTIHTTERTPEHPDLLRNTITNLLDTCSNEDGKHPVPGLPPKDPDGQYKAPYVGSDSIRTPSLPPPELPITVPDPSGTETAITRHVPPRTRPYLFLYRPDGLHPDTKGKTFPECDALLAHDAARWHLPTLTGFTNSEWLLTQHREVETRAPLTPEERTTLHGDPRIHAFDGYTDTPATSRWGWNLDSRVPEGCARGGWAPAGRQSDLDGSGASIRHPRLGARSAVVVEL